MFKKTYRYGVDFIGHYSMSNNLKSGQIYGNQSMLNVINEQYSDTIIQRKDTAEYLNGIETGLARHHIIPDSVLREFIIKVRKERYICQYS